MKSYRTTQEIRQVVMRKLKPGLDNPEMYEETQNQEK